DILDLSKHSSIPIINGLSDLYHPCQALTDIFSIKEKLGKCEGITLSYIGDGNNVCHSLLLGCAKVGMNIQVATPKGYEADDVIIKQAQKYAQISGSKIKLTNDPVEGIKDADAIYADVWVSMGQEEESKERLKLFEEYQVNNTLVGHASPHYIFMHCLPAHRGQEVTADIIDGEHSIVFDQAENRLHTQKAIMIFLMNPNI
ncbi:Ornithine carbamoyltransferase, partial [hydrothermal vent metagenome]